MSKLSCPKAELVKGGCPDDVAEDVHGKLSAMGIGHGEILAWVAQCGPAGVDDDPGTGQDVPHHAPQAAYSPLR